MTERGQQPRAQRPLRGPAADMPSPEAFAEEEEDWLLGTVFVAFSYLGSQRAPFLNPVFRAAAHARNQSGWK